MFDGLIYWSKVAAAVGLLGGMALGVGDYTELRPPTLKEIRAELSPMKVQIKQIADTTLLLRWQLLNSKRLYGGGLTFEELREFCALSRELGYIGIPECGI